LFLISLALFLFDPSLTAQESPKDSCEIPLVVTRYTQSYASREIVRDLTPQNIDAHPDEEPISVTSIRLDDGPKRLAILLDASKNVPAEEWQLQTEMAAKFLEYARPSDKFSIFLVGVPAPSEPFYSSKAAIERLKKLHKDRPSATESGERNYDALAVAAQSLTPSLFGDSIFFFGHDADEESKTDPAQLTKMLLQNHIRVYAISFRSPQFPPNFDPNKGVPAFTEGSKLPEITRASGTFFSYHDVHVFQMSGQKQLFENFLGDLFLMVADPYRLTVPVGTSPEPRKLSLSIKDAKQLRIDKDEVRFPRSIYPCPLS